MSQDFASLLAHARQGDGDALDQLAHQYEAKLRIVARGLLGPALRPYLDSMDLVQSIHRSLLVGLRDDKYDVSTPERLIALALTMLRRKVARQWRRMRRQERLPTSPSGSGDSRLLAPLLISLSKPHDDPALAAQFHDAVLNLCRSMSLDEQKIVELRLQGYSTDEIAGQLGLQPVALRVRMTRLRQRLIGAGVLDDWL